MFLGLMSISISAFSAFLGCAWPYDPDVYRDLETLCPGESVKSEREDRFVNYVFCPFVSVITFGAGINLCPLTS